MPSSTGPGTPSGVPLVVVLGMHRSGTSALAGAVAGLGLSLPPQHDLMASTAGNPAHFESTELTALNDSVLEVLGGTWRAPPDLAAGWESQARAAGCDQDARASLARIFAGAGPNVWKDPRNCLLLPYWRRLFTEPLVAALIWRSPMAVARSLHERDGLSIVHGLALWEHYNREALEGMEGLPVYITSNEALLREPRGICKELAAWLEETGVVLADGWDVDAASSAVEPELSHFGDDDGDQYLQPGQLELAARLRSLEGPHPKLGPVELGQMSRRSVGVLDVQRDLAERDFRLAAVARTHAELAAEHQGLITSHHELIDAHRHLIEVCDDRLAHIHRLDDDATRLNAALASMQEQYDGVREERDVWQQRSDRLMDEIERIWSSGSWRITAPFRSLTGALHQRDDRGAD